LTSAALVFEFPFRVIRAFRGHRPVVRPPRNPRNLRFEILDRFANPRITLGHDMSGRGKKILFGAVCSLLVFSAVYAAVTRRNIGGWFEHGRCICGHTVYVHLHGDGYFTYAPGHGVPEHRDYNIRHNGSDFDVVALRPPDWAFSPTPEGKIVARLRVKNGAVYECWSSTTNWTCLKPVPAPFRIWLAKLLKE
jgi:hypothetical protein